MRPTSLATVVFTALTTLAGCSSENVSSTSAAASPSAASFCDAYCQKSNECDSGSDLQTCTESCEESIGTIAAKGSAPGDTPFV